MATPIAGTPRDWLWRGLQVRYTFLRSPEPDPRSSDQSIKPATSAVGDIVPTATLSPTLPLPPIVCIHGFGAAIGHWRKNLPIWSQTRACYAIDLPGFGASRKGDQPYGVAYWAELVVDFVQTVVGEPVVLVGNSIGSLVSVIAADLAPDWVTQLVLISLPDPAMRQALIPPAMPGFVSQWINQLEQGVGQAIARSGLVRLILQAVRPPERLTQFAQAAYQDTTAVTPELIQILSTPAYDPEAPAALTALVLRATRSDYCPGIAAAIARLQIPILLTWGKNDRLVPPALVRPHAYAHGNPHVQLYELEAAGHCPHDECPDRFNQLILHWLNTGNLPQSIAPGSAEPCGS